MSNKLSFQSPVIKGLLAIVIVAGLLTLLQQNQAKLLGKKPTSAAPRTMPKPKLVADPVLNQLRADLKQSPNSPELLTTLAEALTAKTKEQADQNLILELIQALSKILEIEPKNSWALIQLADLSFDYQMFDKAEGYYQRYLYVEPEDLAARTRYASSLIFLGGPGRAIAELDSVLAKDSKNFQALAFKAIALAEQGDQSQALELADQAIALAPSDEARERFSSFLMSLSNKKEPSESMPAERGNVAKRDAAPAQVGSLEDYFKSHAIIGPKLVELKTSEGVLEVIVKDFPIAAMPEFAKASLIQKIKDAAKQSTYKQVVIFDQANADQKIVIDLK